jgi:hypothetical protein
MADEDNKDQQQQQLTAEATALQCSSDHDLRSPCYCEENVWRLVYRHLNTKEISDGWQYNVVFISNQRKCCPMFSQLAAINDPKGYVCWDYHVIVVRCKRGAEAQNGSTAQVLDIDTQLTPYPCPFEVYLDGTFPYAANCQMDEQYMPLFRVIDGNEYLKYFYSDRSHMLNEGEWSAPPPSYGPIMNGLQFRKQTGDGEESEIQSNLELYVNMSNDKVGAEANNGPLTLTEFRSRYTKRSNCTKKVK